jgi:hypothetical protein
MRISSYLLTHSSTSVPTLRARLNVLLGHFLVLRGERRKEAELCDPSLLAYSSTEGPTPCHAISSWPAVYDGCLGPVLLIALGS